jgi:pimeloyl-ACP methyl ester carboxylesterase
MSDKTQAALDRRTGISYLQRPGGGPLVMALHGIGSSAQSFARFLDRFGGQGHLIAWNAPGYLDSTPLKADWPLAMDYAEALERFADSQQIDQMCLLGHSLGCLMAAAFALRCPGRVTHLVLASPALGYQVPVGGVMPEAMQNRLSELAKQGPEDFARARSARLLHAPEKNPQLVEAVFQEMAKINPPGYQQAVRMLASGNLIADMAQLQVEPGFIIGSGDLVTPPEQTYSAAAAWAGQHGHQPAIEEIGDAGHAVYLQKPDEFIERFKKLAAIGQPS